MSERERERGQKISAPADLRNRTVIFIRAAAAANELSFTHYIRSFILRKFCPSSGQKIRGPKVNALSLKRGITFALIGD